MNIAPRKRAAAPIPVAPLLRRLRDRQVSQSQFALDQGYTPADITNWKARGIPRAELAKVAAWCGLSIEAFIAEASGKPVAPRQLQIDTAALVANYEALPQGLKEYVARKTADLRAFVDSLPAYAREGLRQAPADPARMREWEREIEASMSGYLNPRR